MSNNFLEVKISVKDESRKLVTKHALYLDNVEVNNRDPTLKALVEETIKEFKGDLDSLDFDVVVNIKYTW